MLKAMLFRFILILLLLNTISGTAQNNWTRCSVGLPDSTTVTKLTSIGHVVYAGTKKFGVFESVDHGDHWVNLPFPEGTKFNTTGGMASIDTFLFAAQIGPGVFRKSLHSSGWTLMVNGLDNKLIQDIIAANRVLYAATYGGGVYYSDDLAESWHVLFDNAGLDDLKTYSLAANHDTLYLGTLGTNSIPDTGVAYRAAFDGTAWTRINEGFDRNGVHLEQVFSMEANDSLVFAGTDDVGLYRSTSNGDLWIPVGGYHGDIHAILNTGEVVYYGTSYSGVYRSLDRGQTWNSNNIGFALGNMTLPNIVKDFVQIGETIFAASDIGIFRQVIPEVTTSTFSIEIEKLSLTNFPNPFAYQTQFQCLLPTSGKASLKLYDTFGREMITVCNGKLKSGMHQFDFENNSFPPGLYFAILQSETGSVSAKIILQ